MHTFKTNETIFHYNSDLSGCIEVQFRKAKTSVYMNGRCLKKFIANFVRSEKISELESMEDDQVLGIKKSSNNPTYEIDKFEKQFEKMKSIIIDLINDLEMIKDSDEIDPCYCLSKAPDDITETIPCNYCKAKQFIKDLKA